MAKSKAKAKAKLDAPPEPDALVRQAAGTYRSGDDRFEVRQADVGWFLVDSTQSNEFGQELIHGPFPTLKVVREAIPGARVTTTRPLPKPARPKATAAKAKAAKPKPRTWIDELPAAEARGVRRLIGALEGEGIADAEALVRRDRDGLLPAIATRRIEQRLGAAVEELPEKERAAAAKLVRRVAEILSAEGAPNAALPGWTLVEIGLGEEPPRQRRIDLRK
jgi:hypothetical protein